MGHWIYSSFSAGAAQIRKLTENSTSDNASDQNVSDSSLEEKLRATEHKLSAALRKLHLAEDQAAENKLFAKRLQETFELLKAQKNTFKQNILEEIRSLKGET